MKLSPEQQLEKKARENVRKLINRVSSEYSFKKWRNLHGYLYSIGIDKAVIDSTPDKELKREELDELLRQYEEEAFKQFNKPATEVDVGIRNTTTPIVAERSDIRQDSNKETAEKILQDVSRVENLAGAVEKRFNETEEKLTEKNNYGLKESEKELATLTWFQKKAAAELLKGFGI